MPYKTSGMHIGAFKCSVYYIDTLRKEKHIVTFNNKV